MHALEPVALRLEVDAALVVEGSQPAGWSQTFSGRRVHLHTDDGYALEAAVGNATPTRLGYRGITYEATWEAGKLPLVTSPTPAGLGVSPRLIVIHQGGQAVRLEPSSEVFSQIAAGADGVLRSVRKGIVAALAYPWDRADEVKEKGPALEVLYPESGAQPGEMQPARATEAPAETGPGPMPTVTPQGDSASTYPGSGMAVIASPCWWIVDGERVDRGAPIVTGWPQGGLSSHCRWQGDRHRSPGCAWQPPADCR